MVALFTPQGLALLEFCRETKGLDAEWRAVERHAGGAAEPGDDARTRALGAEIEAYFNGQLTAFKTPLDLVGTPFQKSVWQALLDIPYGQTRSYAQQARQIDRPTATRAVAAANGQNKIAIIVPCHRVIGSNGQLTGYGGGLPRKQWLLALESGTSLLTLSPNCRSADG
ncbi:methylated-DNA--[protein]-cysteine S-methyltransferase [Ottowia testudinis]|uniref:Methylated-DNA--protein-cysteine methyltransferase n=2 Tax=Ottowia testudinis TaxID=2816950 RepID=A0A975H5F1_9BURK|nr:methylated-DNA--[protein]-cysteine S-methyltransferase [Ottowia testudinis]